MKKKKVIKKKKKLDFCCAYNILMDYWDELSPESQTEADKRLSEIGL